VLAASLPAFVVLALPLPWPATLALSLVVYIGIALAVRALPFELFHALRGR
jgi:hypothetical protein